MNNYREEIISIFDNLNKDLVNKGYFAKLILLGGKLGQYYFGDEYKITLDTDVQILEGYSDLYDLLLDNGIHVIGGVMEIPPSEEIEFSEEIMFSNLTLLIPKIEYFALSKLMSQRGKDLNDLESYPILDHCDIIYLKYMIEDYKGYLLNPDSREYNFYHFNRLKNIRGI